MTPTEILPVLTADELSALADWLRRLPLSVYHTTTVEKQVDDLRLELEFLAVKRKWE